MTVYLGKNGGYFETPITTISSRNFVYTDPAYVGDFNGDGCSDMLVQWVDYGSRQLLVYKGNSDGTFSPGENLSSDYPHAPETYPGEYFVTDVNGDGKDDFVLHYKDSNNRRSALVYYGTSEMPYLNDAIDALISTNSYVESDPVFVGDINGDGRMVVMISLLNIRMATAMRFDTSRNIFREFYAYH